MIRIGSESWIDPEDVVGVVWTETEDGGHPSVLMRGGHRVSADHYKAERGYIVEHWRTRPVEKLITRILSAKGRK